MKLKPIFYDTETTGISSERDRIVEIAAFDPERNESFHSLIHPGCPIPKEVQAIHGITDEMVQGAPAFSEAGRAFFEFCGPHAVLVAHNNDEFDRHFLREESKRHSVEHPPLAMFDTLKWARKYRSDLPRHSLQFLRQVFGIKENRAHRALDDVMVLYEVYRALVDDLTIEQALALMAPKK